VSCTFSPRTATLVTGVSDSSPCSASCNLLRFTWAEAFLCTSTRASYSGLYRAGIGFLPLTAVVEVRVEAGRRVLVPAVRRTRKGFDVRHVVQEGQKKVLSRRVSRIRGGSGLELLFMMGDITVFPACCLAACYAVLLFWAPA
jgi:hypothetical protein